MFRGTFTVGSTTLEVRGKHSPRPQDNTWMVKIGTPGRLDAGPASFCQFSFSVRALPVTVCRRSWRCPSPPEQPKRAVAFAAPFHSALSLTPLPCPPPCVLADRILWCTAPSGQLRLQVPGGLGLTRARRMTVAFKGAGRSSKPM
jgi:hypothetical protein